MSVLKSSFIVKLRQGLQDCYDEIKMLLFNCPEKRIVTFLVPKRNIRRHRVCHLQNPGIARIFGKDTSLYEIGISLGFLISGFTGTISLFFRAICLIEFVHFLCYAAEENITVCFVRTS